MNQPTLFDQFRELRIRQPLEVAQKLTKVKTALLFAEDLIEAVENMVLPASEFLQNNSIKNLLAAKEKLDKVLKDNEKHP